MQLEAYRSVDIWEAASRPGQLKVINTKIRQLKHLPTDAAVLNKVLVTDRDCITAYFEQQRNHAKLQYPEAVELNDLQMLGQYICYAGHAENQQSGGGACFESGYGRVERMINEAPIPLCTGSDARPFGICPDMHKLNISFTVTEEQEAWAIDESIRNQNRNHRALQKSGI